MGSWEHKYPHISLLLSVKPSPRILLGQRLLWTMKEDGECVTIWKNERAVKKHFWSRRHIQKVIQISSRNLVQALPDIVNRVESSEDYPKILKLLEDNPQFVCYVEECRKGRSVTGVKVYDRTYLFLFDIFDRSAKRFLSYVNVYQHAFHYKIPVVKLYAETRHRSMKDLLKFKNHVLKYCHAMGEEGMVIKAYKIPERFKNWEAFKHGLIQAKVKIDVPESKKRKISRGLPILPPIPENEILGAINKVHQELGDDKFMETKEAMPLIAKFVGEECKKHLYSKPQVKLFSLYGEYKERMILNDSK